MLSDLELVGFSLLLFILFVFFLDLSQLSYLPLHIRHLLLLSLNLLVLACNIMRTKLLLLVQFFLEFDIFIFNLFVPEQLVFQVHLLLKLLVIEDFILLKEDGVITFNHLLQH